MTAGHRITIALTVAVLATVGAMVWYPLLNERADDNEHAPLPDTPSPPESAADGSLVIGDRLVKRSPPSVEDEVSPSAGRSMLGAGDDPESESVDSASDATGFDTDPWQAAADAAGAGWSDTAFDQALARLQADPAFRQAIEQQLHQEIDTDRIRRLSQLLGALSDVTVTDLAQQMLSSGSPPARFGAMDLLRRLQAIDPRVRDIALDLLSTTSEEQELVAAMNILAMPAVALPEQYAAIVTQLSSLTDNPSATVRRQSYGILGRWIDDESTAPIMAAGLADADRAVRESVAYALVDYPHDDPSLKQALWSIIADDERQRSERDAALLAFESMPLSDSEQQQALAMRERWQQR